MCIEIKIGKIVKTSYKLAYAVTFWDTLSIYICIILHRFIVFYYGTVRKFTSIVFRTWRMIFATTF